MKELTMQELDGQQAELLPSRETLSFYGGDTYISNWASISASNTSLAMNVASVCSNAYSSAGQYISVTQ